MADEVQQAKPWDAASDTAEVGPETGGATLLRLLSAVQALASSQQRIEDKLSRLAAGLAIDMEVQPAAAQTAQGRASEALAGASGHCRGHSGFRTHVDHLEVAVSHGLSSGQPHKWSKHNNGSEPHADGADGAVEMCRELSGPAKASDASSIASCDGLPAAWPACLTLRFGFEEDQEATRTDSENFESFLAKRRGSESHGILGMDVIKSTSLTLSGWCSFCCPGCNKVVLNPGSPCMMLNDFVSFNLLMHDLLVIPVILSWDIVVEGTLLHLAWCASLYWTLDLVINFMIGFYRQGELIMTQPEVCRHYLRTSFFLDLLPLMGDWASLMASVNHDPGSGLDRTAVLTVATVGRLLKVLRVSRLIKLLERISSSAASHNMRMLSQVLKLVCGTLLSNHILCCAWYRLGRAGPTETGLGWLDTPLFADEDTIRGADPIYQYLSSFQWTVAQITLGSSDIVPVNRLERLFNILMLLAGLLFGSTIMAFLSAQIVQFIMLRKDRTQKLDDLRTFLRQAAVPSALSVRVMTQVSERLSEEKMLDEADVAALGLLSGTLRSELVVATRLPHLVTHPLFQTWTELDMGAARALCDEAVCLSFVPNRDVVFVPGTIAEQAHYIIRGRLRYTQVPESAKVLGETVTDVQQGSWLCEAGLWSEWAHVGMLEARTACQLLSVSASGLLQILQKFVTVASMTKSYGRNFHMRLASAMPPHAEWPSDLCVPFTSASELLSKQVGIALLRHARRTGLVSLSPEQGEQLKEELRRGLCSLQQSKEGLERIVTLVTVRLEQDGHAFLQVGKWDAARGSRPVCQLPGGKRAAWELPHAALTRVVSKDLAPLEPYLTFDGMEHSVERKDSPQYGMPTMYMRTTHRASLVVPRHQIQLPMASSTAVCLDPSGLSTIAQREVFMLPDGKGLALYCWLLPAERELLEAPANAAAWKQWMGQLHTAQLSFDDI